MVKELAGSDIEFVLVDTSIEESVSIIKDIYDYGGITFTAMDNGKEVGSMVAGPGKIREYETLKGIFNEKDHGDSVMLFDMLSVRKEYRNRGIAKMLIKDAIEYTKKLGIKWAFLSAVPTSGSMSDLVRLYSSLGFKTIGGDKKLTRMILNIK
jgi:GNAT superfamily N-acetyltransferase